MGYDNQLTSVAGALDLVITHVVVVDPLLGVIKADVGIKDGYPTHRGQSGDVRGHGGWQARHCTRRAEHPPQPDALLQLVLCLLSAISCQPGMAETADPAP
jgi:hypothetical protein